MSFKIVNSYIHLDYITVFLMGVGLKHAYVRGQYIEVPFALFTPVFYIGFHLIDIIKK